MSNLVIRPLDSSSEAELNTIVAFAMMTIWETCPEARRNPEIVPHFSFDAMKGNYQATAGTPDRCFLVAQAEDSLLCGHTIFKISEDEAGTPYGYCFTRYVLPAFRRRGLGARFLEMALEWFAQKGAAYAVAHTSVTNRPLLVLFEKYGFTIRNRYDHPWPAYELRKDLSGIH